MVLNVTVVLINTPGNVSNTIIPTGLNVIRLRLQLQRGSQNKLSRSNTYLNQFLTSLSFNCEQLPRYRTNLVWLYLLQMCNATIYPAYRYSFTMKKECIIRTYPRKCESEQSDSVQSRACDRTREGDSIQYPIWLAIWLKSTKKQFGFLPYE